MSLSFRALCEEGQVHGWNAHNVMRGALQQQRESGQSATHRTELEVALALRQARAADDQRQQGRVLRMLPGELQGLHRLSSRQRRVRWPVPRTVITTVSTCPGCCTWQFTRLVSLACSVPASLSSVLLFVKLPQLGDRAAHLYMGPSSWCQRWQTRWNCSLLLTVKSYRLPHSQCCLGAGSAENGLRPPGGTHY